MEVVDAHAMTSMSAAQVLPTTANISASTLLVPTHVNATLDTDWMLMEGIVQRSMSVTMGLTSVNTPALIHQVHMFAPATLDTPSLAMDSPALILMSVQKAETGVPRSAVIHQAPTPAAVNQGMP